ncbi:MAG TPA: glycosyl hydrolase family 79 C-terminal domain-containing protein [Bryobacteraceae bacterium]|nr:glycosyl hydrolase family 79 C-terminal domain-containing protein [Bryobacteraceae bacterium]
MKTRIHRRRFLASGAAAIAVPFLSGQDTGANVEIHVDPSRALGKVPNDFLGFGYEISSVAVKGLLSPRNRVLLQYYRNLGPEGVVRIGGNTADWSVWSPDGQPVSAPKATVTNTAVVKDLGDFLQATGWKLIWNLNLGNGSAESATDQAAAIADAVKDRLLCFQIGNEPDLFARSGHRPESYSYSDYHQEFLRFASALRKRLPGAPLAGPDVAGATPWVKSFAEDEGKQLKLLTHHYYRAGQRQPAATISNLLHTDARLVDILKQLRADSRACGIPYRVVEINSFSGGGKPGVSDTFTSALWALDLLFTLSAYDCAGLNLETGLNQLGFVSSYSPIFDDQQGHFTARPSYYAMLAFAIAGRGKRIACDMSSSGANVTAYAALDNNQHPWITIINKDTSKGIRAAVSSTSSFHSAEVMRLSAPSYDAKTGTRLAGAVVSSEGHWKPKNIDKLKQTDGRVVLNLEPASAALVKLN